MGDNYVEKIAEVNGFNSKSSLMRFMLSSATPSFITNELNITEDQAVKFAASKCLPMTLLMWSRLSDFHPMKKCY